MRLFTRVSVLVLSSILVTACQSEPDTSKEPVKSVVKTAASKAVSLREVKPAGADLVVKKSYLRDVLPDSAYAYARIPNSWSMLGSPKGNVFDKATGSKAFVDALSSIKEGFGTNVISDLPEESQLLVKFLMKYATSSIEAAVLPSAKSANSIPNLLITTAVDFNSADTLNAILGKLAEQIPMMNIVKPVENNSVGVISIAGMQTQVKLDKATSRVFLLAGAKLQETSLTDSLQSLIPNTASEMTKFEKGIDSSGQGLFVWANSRKLVELGSALGEQRQMAPLAMLGINSMKNIAFGIGTSNGINRLKFVLEMPQTGFRSFIPVVKGIPAFNVVGKPNGVAIIGMPSKSDFISIEGSLAALSTPKTMEGYYKGKQVFSEKTGFSIEDIFATLGQDISLVSDEAGYYVVVRLKDAEKFNVMLNSSVKNFGLKYSKHKVGGHEYSHLRVPSINSLSISMAQEEAARKGQQANNDKGLMMLKRFLDVPSHIYWEQEGDYLVMASIPQVLMDRHYIQPHTPVNQWLKKEQRMDAEGALLLASMRNEGVPEFMYRMNLGMLSYLGDITERPVNMFALPTPREAQLPKEGTYGIKITSSETQLGFELAFEDNPLEFIIAGSNAYQGVAVVGILAAIAIPAYQDYVVRAEMTGAFIGGKSIQSRLEIFELENGHFPNKEEIVEFDQNNMVTDKYSISINPDDGKIIVRVHNKSLSSANQLFMIPQKQDGRLSWKCESDIAKKYLPQSCR